MKVKFSTSLFQTPSFFWIVLFCVMTGLLATVAVTQIRATREMVEATEIRIGGDLESRMMDWHLDFFRQFSDICVAFQVGPDSAEFDDWRIFTRRYKDWRLTAQHPQLVQAVYIWETSQKTTWLAQLDPSAKVSEAQPPGNLNPLLQRLKSRSSSIDSGLRAWQPIDSAPPQSAASTPHHPLQYYALTGWQFDPNIPAIVHPIVHHKLPLRIDAPASPAAIDWIIIVLDVRTIQSQILPNLALRDFGPSHRDDYSIAVASLGDPYRVLYESSPHRSGIALDQSDAAMNIFGPPPASLEGESWEALRNANSLKVQNWRRFSSPIWFPVISYSDRASPWMLILIHRNGHLADVVNRARRADLLTNGAVFLLLAAGITIGAIAGHRAQSYARMEMQFIASVSHELRTPLTALYSAGENLADGVVKEEAQLRSYGAIITTQARQLTLLVDQILDFSATVQRPRHYTMRPLEVKQIVDFALQNVRAAIHEAGFTVQLDIASDLPPVRGDLNALASCIQNLLLNAVKYSGKSRWVRVSAQQVPVRNGFEVNISVEDREIGIAPSELAQIFKPFYRSSQVKKAQIHGTVLGLALAKGIVEAMGGRLTVKSALGTGSIFTLHLPGVNLNLHNGPNPEGADDHE